MPYDKHYKTISIVEKNKAAKEKKCQGWSMAHLDRVVRKVLTKNG